MLYYKSASNIVCPSGSHCFLQRYYLCRNPLLADCPQRKRAREWHSRTRNNLHKTAFVPTDWRANTLQFEYDFWVSYYYQQLFTTFLHIISSLKFFIACLRASRLNAREASRSEALGHWEGNSCAFGTIGFPSTPHAP